MCVHLYVHVCACVCVYMCMYMCMYAHAYVHAMWLDGMTSLDTTCAHLINMLMHTRICTCTHALHTCTCTCTCTCPSTSTSSPHIHISQPGLCLGVGRVRSKKSTGDARGSLGALGDVRLASHVLLLRGCWLFELQIRIAAFCFLQLCT